MKFFSSASTAALACLLSLLPAVLGGPYYQCVYDQKFSLAKLKRKKSSYTVTNAKAGDPLDPNGDFYPTDRFTRKAWRGIKTEYLFQLIDEEPTFRVYEKQFYEFFRCPLQEK
ncbi:putative candidate secreted effector protein [Blumeria hordei DH14]|uniref:Putative candidate secreted effector protein n=1 Tax=Blumeria graminis f. sp. hordei (strain DH14) TaxID=546991 RepID=N1JJ06_BLUG1|nr:putative candidate secreted effector protein [Blumeria hordei DH14]